MRFNIVNLTKLEERVMSFAAFPSPSPFAQMPAASASATGDVRPAKTAQKIEGRTNADNNEVNTGDFARMMQDKAEADRAANDETAAPLVTSSSQSPSLPSADAASQKTGSETAAVLSVMALTVAPKTTQAEPAALDETTLQGLNQAMDTLKAALQAALAGGKPDETADASASVSDEAAENEAPDQVADAQAVTLSDAQLTGLMQALLSGKPLDPAVQSKIDTPEVAQALSGLRTQIEAALEKHKEPVSGFLNALTPAAASDSEVQALLTGVKVPLPKGDGSKTITTKEGQKATVTSEVSLKDQARPESGVKTAAIVTSDDVSAGKASETAAPASQPLIDAMNARAQEASVKPDTSQTAGASQTAASVPQAAEAGKPAQPAMPPASYLSTAAAHNIAAMSAHITRQLSHKSTEFSMELHPADMGRVDVKLSIANDGTLRAALSFDSPVAESQFRAQADELRRQLETQGFQLGEGALSFASRQDGRGGQSSGAPTSDAQTLLAADADQIPDTGPFQTTQAFRDPADYEEASRSGMALAQKLGLNLLGTPTYRLSLNVTA